MKRLYAFFFIFSLFIEVNLFAQTYTPIPVTGFNFDAIAETPPNSSATTTGTMDASNHVMYSVNFAAGAGFTGGVINSGTIVSGTRTYQLRPFNGTNAVYVANGNTKTITLTTPVQYSLVSLLIFSTEGPSNINVTFNYVGGSTTNFGASNILDWFTGTGSVYCCFGRCTRVTSGSVCDGVPNNPNFYPLDFSLSCADQQKNLQSITITTTSGNQGVYVMAVSGAAYVQTNSITPVVNVSCNGGANGSATASITGVNSPFTYSWNSAPVQTTATASNLPAGNYTCTINDSKGCPSTATVTITEPPALTLTLTPTNASCGANNGNISVSAGGGTSPYSYSINGGAFSGTANFPNLGAGTYTITLQDNNNCQTSAIATLTMSGSTNVTVNSASICSGVSVVLTANGATTYSWSPGTGLSSTSGASVTAIPSTTTIYTVTGTAGTCSGTAIATVTVTPTPTVIVNSATVCAGNSATLNASGATTYSWSPATGLSSTSGASVTANPIGTTVYTITGTNGVCTSSNTSTVVVNLLPAITVASATTCIGTPATLTASGATTYTWNTLGTGASITLSPNITTSYTVVGTDNNACVNFATGTITVNTLPTITVNNLAICNGANGTLTASGATSFTWNPSIGLSSSTGSVVIANPNATSSYTVTGTDANGCIGNATSNVIVHSLPVVTATSINICQGSFGVLSAGGAATYSWTPSTGLSSSIGASVTANPNTTTNYTVIGTDANACKNIATAVITVNSAPQISISPQVSSGCAPLCVSFSNTTTATGTYNWNFNDGHTSTSAAPQNCFIGKGSYSISLTLTDANGCKQTTIANVTVFPSPHADFNPTPQPTSILEPKITFVNTSSGSTNNTWNWNFGDPQNTTSTIQNPSYVYASPGEYAVQLVVISSNDCRDSITRIIKIDSEDVIYVPNAFSPNEDGINDIFTPKGEGLTDYKLSIFDRWGNQVFASNDLYKGWDGRKGNDVVQQDLYVWKIELKDSNGQSRQFSGVVSLIK